jgi:hypothetical protein
MTQPFDEIDEFDGRGRRQHPDSPKGWDFWNPGDPYLFRSRRLNRVTINLYWVFHPKQYWAARDSRQW